MQPPATLQLRERSLAAQRIPEAREHALGVIAGRRGFDHPRGALRVESSQQQRRFHLRAGHGHAVFDALQRGSAMDLEWGLTTGGGIDLRAHQPQRLRHARHRAARERGVSHQSRGKRLAGQQTCEQPHRRARIAQIEITRRRLQSVQAHAVHRHAPGRWTVDAHAHRTERSQSGEAVLTLEKTLDLGHTLGDRAQHDRAMRDGFVACHADLPA